MYDYDEYVEQYAPELIRLSQEYVEQGVRFYQSQHIDLPGSLRVKMCPFEKITTLSGEGMNAAILTSTHGDGEPDGDYLFEAPVASLENGYPNIVAVPDPASMIHLGWQADTAAVLYNLVMLDGSPCPLDIRGRLKALEERAREMGYTAEVGIEYELVIYHSDTDLLREGRFSELRPFGRGIKGFNHLWHLELENLAQEFIDRMASINIDVVSFHAETGNGMVEFALAPQSPLQAADNAVRAKFYLSQFCQEKNLVVSFMARSRPMHKETANGAHHHQSLLVDGRNVFFDEQTQGFSPTALQYVAGLLKTMPDFHLIFRPTINSYRRFNRLEWSPENVSWGIENRCCALRAIPGPAAKHARIEHRVPGSDVNPYLSLAAMLAGGLMGIENKWEPGPPCAGDPDGENEYPRLPASMADSIEAFRQSEWVKEAFGEEFSHHYLLSRQAEERAFAKWLASNISDFEYVRYFLGY